MSYRCWHIDDYDPEDPGKGWAAKSARTGACAAEDYAERHHGGNDYAKRVDVVVMSPDGSLRVLEVVARQVLSFHARVSETPVPTVSREEVGDV